MEEKNFFYFKHKKKYNFKGGLKYLFKKKTFNNFPLKSLPLPDQFFIFIKDNIYNKKLRVKVNEKVLRGQPLIVGDDFNVPIHSPTSGWIQDIFFDINPFNKYKKNIKIVISSDNLDQWIKLKKIQNYKKYTPEKLIKIIHQSGVVGLGGGEFSSAKKLILSIDHKVHTLIVNAVESEPYITSDNCLINNYIDEILTGCKIISWITKIKKIIIAIREDSTESILKIDSLIKNKSLFKICIIKNKYPAGSSKILIKSLIGQEVPHNKHATDIGYLIFNVATIFSIKRAIVNGEPLTERIVTCISDQNFLSGNFWMRIGTPIKHFLTDNDLKKCFIASVYLGGFFMGKKVYNFNDSISKNTNCISIQFKKKKNQNIFEENCIRCGYCSNVCPVNLLPQQLYLYCKNNDHQQTKNHYITDCIECKACEKVCPSNIPLVRYFKKEKKNLTDIIVENDRKRLSLIRFKNKEKRLLEIKKIMNIKDKKNNFINNNCINLIQEKDKKINNINRDSRRKIVEEAIKRMRAKK